MRKIVWAVLTALMGVLSTAWARTVDVVSQDATSVTLKFSVGDGRSCRLFLASGATDAGDDKHAWEGFLELGQVEASETTRVVEVPAPLRDGRFLRFYLLQTQDIAMAKELKGVYSTGQQWVDTGLIPTARWVVDFRFGEDTYVHATAFFGQNWTSNRYLFNQQSNTFYFHANNNLNTQPMSGTDYRFVMDDDNRGYLTFNGQTKMFSLGRSVDSSGHFGIFASNDASNEANKDKHCATFRFDRMKIADRNLLLRDYIPAMNAAGEAGIYDQRHDRFYASNTATPLVAGEEWTDGRSGRVLDETVSFRFRRAVTITEQTRDQVTFRFDNPDRSACTLHVAYGKTDCGEKKLAWTSFDTITTVDPNMTSYVYTVPDALKADGMFYRFFLVRTSGLPYSTEVASLTSTGDQVVRTGFCPTLDTTVDFDFGNVTYVSGTALLGQAWTGYAYLLNMQGSTQFYFHGQDGKIITGVEAGKNYNFRTTEMGQAIISDGTKSTGVTELHFSNPLSELTVFGCYSVTKGSKFRFDGLRIDEAGFRVRDFVPVVVAGGKGALFDRITGVVYPTQYGSNVEFGHGKNVDRPGWVLNTTYTSTAAGVPVDLVNNRLVLQKDTDAQDFLAKLEAGTEVDLNGHTLFFTAGSATKSAPFTILGDSGTVELTVPEGETYTAAFAIGGGVKLVKKGAGTYVVGTMHQGVRSFLIEAGLVEMGNAAAFGNKMPVTVKNGAAFDTKGWSDNCIDITIEGTGPDGLGALRNTGAALGTGVSQLAGLRLSGDALIYATGHFGLINLNYAPTVLELNGHTLTMDYSKGQGFWMSNTSGSSAGTFIVKQGIPYTYNKSYVVNIPNVDFIIDGADSLFRIPTADYASKTTVGSITLLNGGKYEEGNNNGYMKNFSVLGSGEIGASNHIKWIYLADTLLVSNETATVDIYPPFTANSTYPRIVKKGAGTLNILNNHTDQRFDRGLDLQGGTVVMDSTAGTKNYHVAISSQPVPVTIHAGATLDMTKCTQPFKLTSLVIEEGGTLRHTVNNVIAFPNETTFVGCQPFNFSGTVQLNGDITFSIGELFQKADAPQPGDSISLLKAGTITGTGQILVKGCPYDGVVEFKDDEVLYRLRTPEESGTQPIKIFTLGGSYVIGLATSDGMKAQTSFRVELASRLTRDNGWNVEMTGWRHDFNSVPSGLRQNFPAWNGHSGVLDLALKTSATRAGVLEGLETYCMTAKEPDFTIFFCGEADVADGVPEDTIFANWTAAVRRIRAALPMTTVIGSTLPMASNTLNQRLKDWCEQEPEVECVDLAAYYESGVSCYTYNKTAELLQEKLLTLATKDGKKTPTAWTRPTVTLGAENNVPPEYLAGFTRVRTMDIPAATHYGQYMDAVPYIYAPAFRQTDIAKVGYYVELVNKDSGALYALWVDMDAPGPNWADVSFPVTLAQQKQQAVTSLHVWSNFGAVSPVAASDNSVTGYIEFNCINYGGGDISKPNGIPELWAGQYGFTDTFNASGTSGHGCFQIMRKFSDTAVPAGEVLFALNRFGATSDQPVGIGIGTLANYGKHPWTTSKELDRTFCYGVEGTDSGYISSYAYSLRRLSFYLKYTNDEPVDRVSMARASWTGATNTEIWNLANWETTAGAAPTSFDYTTWRIPEGTTVSFTYPIADSVTHWATTFLIDGNVTYPTTGGFYNDTLDIGPNGSICFDPTMFSYRLRTMPTFQNGGKFRLPAKYQNFTKGRFLLFTIDMAGDTTDAAYANAFDTTTARGTNPKITIERRANGGAYIWLDLADGTVYPKMNILCMGDSITQGSNSSYGNWRTPLMKKLAAAGYTPWTKGFWTIESNDINNQPLPVEWTYHAGISGQHIETLAGGAGTLDAVEVTLDQAGDVDFVLLMLGTNDINGYGTTGETLYPKWVELVKKILQQKPHAKVLAGAVVDMANNAAKDAEVVAFNSKMRAAIEGGVFPAGRVFYTDLYTPCYRYDASGTYIAGSFASATDLHPDWPGEDKMAEAYLATIQSALATAEDGWTLDAAETVTETTSGIANNVPAAERAGFQLARVLDVTKEATTLFTDLGYVPYENEGDPTAATADIGRVGYYIELKRKNKEGCDYHGLTRWMWVTMDAFGDRSIETVGVPLKTIFQGRVKRLRVKTNMPGIESTPAGQNAEGWVEFWPSSYTNGRPGLLDELGNTWGYDWCDTRSDNMSGFGTMQVHLATTGLHNNGQVLFAFNRWTVSGTHEIGLGNFANQVLGSIDYTFAGDSGKGVVETMSAAAYEVARIEIWTTPLATDPEAGAVVDVTAVMTEDGTTTVVGNLADVGLTATQATVTLEWSSSPDFAAGTVQTQALGTFTQAGPLNATVTGLSPNTTWYFRFRAENDNGKSVTTKTEAYELKTAVWRPTDGTATWGSLTWLLNGTGSPVAFEDGWSALFDGQETASPTSVKVEGPVKASIVTVNATRDYLFDGDGSLSAAKLVKKGTGTLTLESSVLGATRDIEIQQGRIKVGDHAKRGALGADGGTVTIKPGASLDVNYIDTASGAMRDRAYISNGKKFVIEGSGVNGEGALTISNGNTYWGSAYNEIVLAGDATIGGNGRMDVRNGTKNSITGGEDMTLTVANTSINGTLGLNVHGPITVGTLAITPGAALTLEGNNGPLTIPHGIELGGYLQVYAANPEWNVSGITVTGTAAAFGNDSGTGYIKAPLMVPGGTQVTLKGSQTTRYPCAVTNAGTIAVSSGTHVFENSSLTTVPGSNFNITGGNLEFSSTEDLSQADLKVTATGGMLWWGIYDTGLYPQAKSIDVSGVTGGTFVFTADGDETIPLAFAPARPTRVYVLNSTLDQTTTMEPGDYVINGRLTLANSVKPGALKVGAGTTVTVQNLYLGDDATNARRGYLEVGEGATFNVTGTTWIGHYPCVKEGSRIVVNGGTFNHTGTSEGVRVGVDAYQAYFDLLSGTANVSGLFCRREYEVPTDRWELFSQNGGTLNIGSLGLNGFTRFRPFVELNNGTVNAAANFDVAPLRSVSFGDTEGGTVDFNIGEKTVNWQTGLRGKADVNLKGHGTFTSGVAKSCNKLRFQGVPTGHWTISNMGVNNLYGAAGFAGGLKLEEDVTANVKIAGESLVECAFVPGAALDDMKTPTACPFVANDMGTMHINGTAEEMSQASFVWQGQFYCDTADTWTFAGGYDDNLYLAIDGKEVINNTTWNSIAQGQIALTVGWHDFRLVERQEGGGWGSVGSGWAGVMNLGFAKSAVSGTAAASFTKFDSEHLPMRPTKGSQGADGLVNWSSVANFNDGTWNTRTDLASNGKFQLSRLHEYNLALTPKIGASTHQFDGYVYVNAAQAGLWTVSLSYDDRISLTIDGVDSGCTPSTTSTSSSMGYVGEGWHRFVLRVADNTGNWGPWSNLGYYARIAVNGHPYYFDETCFEFSSVLPLLEGVSRAGLDGEVELAKGSQLTNDAAGSCPIWGTLKGSGTLAGAFAFAGDANCYEVSGTARRRMVENSIKFDVTNDDALAGLCKVRAIFDQKPGCPFYDVGAAGGVNVETLRVEVRDTAGNDYSDGFSAVVQNGRLLLKNAHPNGCVLLFR
ncbi:MAG: SGNH/GDSL hydrolase family protein [Kiritimatiellae bacterium]|nr:SGNH/GDSL hydrolase family protein [Kiritimatiellia bacterium]